MDVEAMNADIQAFVAPRLPAKPDGLTMEDKAGWEAFNAKFRTAWVAAMAEVDHIRVKHGFVRCADAAGWRYAGR
jgi:hypothetical protein